MKNSTRRSLTRCVRIGAGLLSALTISASIALVDLGAQSGQVPIPIPGRNINMVSGTNFPGGDPFLQRQNEPSIAVSTRNPLHLLGSANDYRTVDIPGLGDGVNGDAWISVFKSFDGGSTWKSTLLPGFRQDVTPEGRSSPLYGLQAGADPVIRAGTNGLFYLGAMAFNRDQDAGKVFVARYIDNNNLEAGDSIAYLSTTVVDVGSEDRFLDKPWIAVDIPRAMKGQGRTDADDRNDRSKLKDKRDKDFDPNKPNPATNKGLPKKPTTGPVCQVPGQAQPIPAGNIYVIYSAFLEPLAQDPNKPRRKGKELEGLGKHRQGVPMEGRTKIMLSRSTDCGATFSRPQQISERSQINQAAVAAIDPNTGTLYVAWREFLSNAQPDAILITRSSDGGKSFSSPITVATIRPFDQGTTPTSFRTNSYPAMTVDATGRVYVAWAQRGVGPGGDARIVVATSPDGRTWSQPIAADNPPQRGHQIMPVLNFGGAKLHLVYWDQRDDVSKMWGEYIDDFIAVNWTGPSAQRPKRHTLDLRAAAGWPGAPPTWGPSAKVSNYLEGVRAGRTAPEQLQFNPPNLPLFSVGTKPFIGDYLDVTMSPSFLSNGDGTWRFNTLPSDPATFFTAWGDNRDVRAPRDGNWVRYTAPTFAGYTGTSIFDPTQPVAVCEPGQAGMRDQNVYSARVSTGLIMSTLGNNKPLGFVTDADGVRRLLQRSFVITVTNPESVVKSVVLHITAQPPGGRASFLQFAQLLDLPVDIAAGSSISREVFVTSTDPRAAVPITVTEGSSANAAGRVYLNPDPTNPDIDNPDIDNPDIDNPDIDNAEAHAITVSNAVVSNPDIDNTTRANPDIDNPDIDNPDIDNSLLANPSIINPDIDNPDIDNPNIINPDIDNPDIDNPDIDNAALTDVTWNVSNVGNTATAYQIKLLLKQAQQQRLLNAGVQFQLVITKTTAAPAISRCAVVEPNRNLTVVNINSPSFVDPSSAQQVSTVINPDIENPDIDNATMALAPGDTARVTLRIYSPLGDTSIGDGAPAGNPLADLAGALADLRNLGVATTSYPVDTADVVAGETTPQIDASIPLIVTETLDDATRGLAYSEVIEQRGSTAPFAFALTTGSLPPGLTLAANGAITGTPTLSGAFTFTVTLSAANDMTATATLTIRVFEPVVVLGGPLPGASVNQAAATTLSATGGFAPYSWSLAAGALPTGVSLSAAGVVSGTPTQSGTFGFTAMATDVASPTRFATGAFQLSVAAGATAQTVNVVEDTATPITLGATGGGPFTFVIGNPPAHGTLTGSGPTFSYTPTLNYNGPDSFTFRVTQGEITSGFATVSINVTPVNDAAAATPMTVNTPQGVALPILLAGSDAENNPLTFSILTGPTAGTLSGTAPNLTYTPPAGFNGNATFSFRAHDGTVFSPSATVTVIVGPPPAGSADVTLALTDTPDPVALGGSIAYSATIHNNGPATATGVSFTLAYPASELLLQSVTPAQGACTAANPIVCTIGSIAPGGDVPVAVVLRSFNRGGSVIVNGAVSATPLDYNTSNNSVAQTTTITGPPTATSDLSVSQSRAPAVVPFAGNVVYTVVVTNNGPSDANGISLFNTFTPAIATFVSSTSSQGACSASGSQVSCTVGALINGASASYTITLQARGSGSLSNTASVIGSQSDPAAANNSSTVATPIENRAPTAINDVAATNEDMATAIAVLGNDNDPDGDALSITGITTPLHGVAQLAGNSISYTPTGDYNGPDSFTYTISDGAGGTANGTVLVSVLSVNDAPNFVAGPNQAIGLGAGPQTVDNWATAIRAGPAGETGQALNFIVSNSNRDLFSSQPAIAPNGTLSYALALGGQGSATVTVVLQDDGDTANGGVDSTTPRAFTIATNISVANVAPSFAAGPNVSTNEDAGAFVPVNNEGGQRSRHTATRLTDGRVLIAGGSADLGTLAGAELYDPATRVQQLTGSMNVARVSHTATRLLNGLVLIVGGSSGAVVLDSAELFNPATGQFTPAAGTLAGGRLGHTATLLPNGRVLVAGGSGPDLEPLNSAEIFDPVTNTFSPTGALGMPRTTHSAARLADGRVLVVAGYTAGGLTTATAEIFDHNTGLFAITGSLTRARGGETATLLPNHLVLVAGGADETSFVLSSELYNPATGEFTPGPNLIAGRYGYDAELLSDGTVLLAGGRTGSAVSDPAQYSASAEIYNPATNSFSPTRGLATARTDFELTALSDGSVLASGGFNADLIVGATELYVSPAPQLVPGWATAISAGQASESGQLLDFIVTNDNNALFSEQPAIDPTGGLSFRSVANASGSATVTLRLHDDGGVANGGVDTSAPQTFVINIASVNDAPNFGKGPDQSLLEDAGPQFVPEWATGMVVGPGNELGQGLDFVVSTDNPGLFAGVPAIDADTGTLTFTPAANANGSAVVSVHLRDTGGTANGGVNVSSLQTFVVTVAPVNDSPRFNPLPGLYQVPANAGPQTVPGWVTGISAGPANENAQSVVLLVTNENNTFFSTQPVISADGTLSFTAAPGATGGATVTVRARDDGGTANGGNDTSLPQDFMIAIGESQNADLAVTQTDAPDAAPSGDNYTYTIRIENLGPGTATGVVLTEDISENLTFVGIVGDGSCVIGPITRFTCQTSAIDSGGIRTLVATVSGPFGTAQSVATVTANEADPNPANNTSTEQTTIDTYPVAVNDNVATASGVAINIDVLGNDTDPDVDAGDALRILAVGGAEHGTVSHVSGTGVLKYTPVPGYTGIDTFSYTVADSITLTSVGLVTVLVTQAVCVAEPADLISWWPGESDATDVRGANNGAAFDRVTFAAGMVGQAFALDGSPGVGILVPASPSLNPSAVTLAAWVRPASNAVQSVIGKAGSFALGVNNLAQATCSVGDFINLAGGSVQVNEWSHVACTSDGITARLYVGGVQVAQAADDAGIPTNDSSLVIGGGDPANPGGEFGGLIDEAMIFGRALSQGEIASIVGAGDAGVCLDRPLVAVADMIATATDTPFTFSPSANDRDPDLPAPAVVATVPLVAAGTPMLTSPGDVAIVESTGLAYFSGGLVSVAAPGAIGILDTTTNTIVGSMAMPVKSAQTLSRVNQTTNIAYFRGSALTAVDGRPGSPTFNQVILSLQLGNIQSMAIDEVRGRLYVTSITNATTSSPFHSRIMLVDVDPSSPTFHQVIDQGPAPGGGSALGVGVNTVSDKVYIAVSGGSASGVYVYDGATLNETLVASTAGAQTVVVNDAANLIYAATGTSLFVIDGASDTRLALITLPASGSLGTLDTRIAVHKATGKVFVRLFEFPNPSRLAVIDGNRTSPTFNTILTFIALGREDNAMVAVDEIANRVVATSNRDLETAVIDVTTNSVIGTIPSTQSTTRVTIDRAHHRAYVIGGIGVLQVIDLASGSLHENLPVGNETSFFAFNPTSQAVYVPATARTTGVQIVNGTGLVGTVPLPHGDGRELFAVANPSTNRIYVLNGGATAAGSSDALPGFVHVIDGASNQSIASVPVGPVPFGLGINTATNKIYVGNGSAFNGVPFAGGLTVIDGVTHATVEADLSQIPRTSTSVGQIALGRDLVANPTTNKVYFRILNGSTTSLGVLNGTTNVATPLPPFAGGGGTNIIRVNPVLNRIYVGEQLAGQTGRIHILDGANDQEIAVVTAGSPSAFVGTQSYLAVNAVTGRVFVADFQQDSVAVIDPATNTIIGTVRVGDGPTAVAVNETLNRVYVGSNYDRRLTIIDGATLQVVSTLQLPLTALRFEVDESASLIYSTPAPGFEQGVMVIADPGGVAPAIVSVTNGAFGSVALNADGSVTYTPNAGFTGTDSFSYSVPDGSGGLTTGAVNVTVSAPLTISGALPDTVVDTVYSQTLTATGGTGPYAWSIISGTGPGGLALNGITGVVNGYAAHAGTFTFTVQVLDMTTLVTATRVYTVRVGPPVIATTSLPGAFVATPYNATVVVGGATGDVQWTLDTGGSPLLTWLTIASSGVLSGTPPNPGTTPPFTVRATDSLSQVASRSFTLSVGAPLDIAPTQLREGVVLETQASLPLVGGNGTRAVTLTAGTLPPGLTLNANGTFSGTPRRHGTFTFTVQATDCTPATTCLNTVTQQTVTRQLALRVSAKEQQSGSQTQPPIAFGGPGGRRVAQVVTVGAQGTLTGIGLQNISCPGFGPVGIDIQRLTENGLPDGTTIASGTSVNSLFGAITVAPAVALPIGAQFAFIVSSPTACTLNNAAVTDQYNAGDAYVDAGAGWASLFSTDGRYDVPSFRTLIQPAMDVGYLSNGRGAGATATLLANGTVLLTGTGTSAEIYDPATNSTTLTGNMSIARNQHTATLLQDGTVLVVGGQTGGIRQASAETYDPNTGTFTLTTGSMSVGRDVHAATRMNDGRVLITGGNINVTPTSSQAVATAEIYDPVTRTFTAAPNMTSTRQVHNSILLQSGRVLVASGFIGGTSSRSAELYDPATNTFTATAGNMQTARGWSAAEMLADGRVLITGGQSGPIRNSAEIYNPVTDSFTTAGSMASLRYQHSMTRLADGSVLVAGGFYEFTVGSYVLPLSSMERFDPATNSFVPAGGMEARRARQPAIRLPNGTVALAGGAGQSWMSANTVEIYSASASPSLTTTTVPDGQIGVAYPPTTLQASGGSGAPYQFAVVSGVLPPGLTLDAAFTLSGTPTVNGAFPVGIRVTDSLNQSTVESLTIRVGSVLVITTPYQLPSAVLNHPYDLQLMASDPVAWSLAPASGIMPVGLVLGADGRITGTPTEFVGRTFAVRAVDARGRTTLKTFSISVQNPLAITTTTLPEAAVRESYTFCLSASNGVTASTWSISGGSLPPGVTLPSNCFANPPTALGTYNFTVQVSDLASPPQVVARDFTIRVSAREQQSFSQTQPTIAFGGTGGRRLAQTITVGASGTLTAFGFNSNTSCQAPVTVDVQRLDARGMPDGTTIASGSLSSGLGGIPISPAVNLGIGDRIAFVLSSTSVCTIADAPVTDSYQAGDAFADAGGGWTALVDSDGRYDIPFRSMIQPSSEVVFLQRSRGRFQATSLNDGRVLMTGNGNTAEVYDPVTRTTVLTGNMTIARMSHTGTLLPGGTVLIAGGRDSSGNRLATAEIYNPATGTFTATAGPMSVPHEEHTATLMNDGRVLIAGGVTQIGSVYQSVATAEIYDPSTMTFSAAGSMLTARSLHTAALLADGRVLLIGGFTSGSVFRSAEIYNPITGTFTGTTGSMAQTRGRAAAARLADGRILITGGESGETVNTAEIYNPATDSFTPTGSMSTRRHSHTATALADGSVLIAGGAEQADSAEYILALATMERWIPGSAAFVPAGSLVARHKYHSAASLPDGSVLIVGGFGQGWMTGQTAEIFDPAAALALAPAALPDASPGIAYSVTFAISGGTAPYQLEMVSGALPTGLNYNAPARTLSGTPTTAGAFTLGFRASDVATHHLEQSYMLRVGSLNTITSPYRLTDASLGQEYSLQLTASGAAPVAWYAGPPSNLPPGLALSSSGLISGTPTTQSYYNFAVRALDANGQLSIKTLSINVVNPMTFATTALPVAGVTESSTYCLSTNGGIGNKTFDLVGGTLPPGVSLQPTGCFTSTPTALGDFGFTVRVTDQSSVPQMINQAFSMRVSARDQLGSTQTGTTIFFGGPGGRRLAQTVTAGVNGLLTAVGSANVFCSVLSVAIQGVRNDGLPDGTTVATGSFQSNLSAISGIPLTPAIPVTIGSRFAVVFSSDTLCDVTNAPATIDGYVAGDGYADSGTGWTPLMTTDGRFDLPSVRSLIQPAAAPGVLRIGRSGHLATPLNDGRILVSSGSSSEVFEPTTNTSVLTGSMTTANRFGFTATRLGNGTVLVVGGSVFANNTTAYPTAAEIFNPATNTFSAAPSPMNFGRSNHTATLLSDGSVLIAGGFGLTSLLQAEIYNPVSQTFTLVGNMVNFRNSHTATLLQDGRVLLFGGNSTVSSAELYDPSNQTFSATGNTTVPRFSGSTATLLANGRVLVVGGADTVSPIVRNSTELYDPSTGTFTATGSMINARQFHTATLLADGSVLVSGGRNLTTATRPLSQHERYLPASGTFVSAGGMLTMRSNHTATNISGGRVVLIGGTSTAGLTSISAEIYDPTTAPALTGVPLPDAEVNSVYAGVTLGATGGSGAPYTIVRDSGSLPPGVTFDPGTFALGVNQTPSVAGVYTFGLRVTDSLGHGVVEPVTLRVSPLEITSLALPAPSFGTPYSFALAATGVGTVSWSVFAGTLPPGLSLVGNTITGTATSTSSGSFTLRAVDSAGQAVKQSFFLTVAAPPIDQQGSSSSGTAISFGGPAGRRLAQTVTAAANATLVGVGSFNITCPTATTVTFQIQGVGLDGRPDGITLATGSGIGNFSGLRVTPPLPMMIGSRYAIVISSAVACDLTNAASTFDGYAAGDGYAETGGGWGLLSDTDGKTDIPFRSLVQLAPDVPALRSFRSAHTAIRLSTGRTLFLSGGGSTEVFDPATNTSTSTGAMVVPRNNFTATLLANDTVLVSGGQTFGSGATTYHSSAEIFDPATAGFTPVAGAMTVARSSHSAVRLPDGRVLITGGFSSTATWQSAEIYDPATQTFSPAGNMTTWRYGHTSILLGDGNVLIAGGLTSQVSAETYDSVTGTFTATAGGMQEPRTSGFTSTLLGDGRVLFTGGAGSVFPSVRNTAELFDPVTRTFTATGNLVAARVSHGAALLPDGSVLLSGGRSQQNAAKPLSLLERYLPASGSFIPAGGMATQRSSHTATPTSDGRVLIAGGSGGASFASSTAEFYDPPSAVALTGVPLPDAELNVAYPGVVLGATGGSGAPYSIGFESGALPPGLSYNAGTLALGVGETPTAVGSFTVGMRVSDSAGHSRLEPLTLRVSPLDITTTVMPQPTQNQPYSFTLGATGVGSVTWSVYAGALPQGLSLIGNTITGTPTSQTGTSFTLLATDSAGQRTKQSFSLFIQLPPADQQSGYDTTRPALVFGGATRLGQRVRTGLTGSLVAARASNLLCPAGTLVTAEVQGSLPSGAPDGVTLASGTATAATFGSIPLSPQLFFAAEASFTLVFSANQQCQLFPSAFDSYAGGDGFIFTTQWQRLTDVDGRYDIPFLTFVQPVTPLRLMTSYRGDHTATTLADGKVLLVSSSDSTADVYDPATGTFTTTGNMRAPRNAHRASLLADGTVLVSGGYNFTGPGNAFTIQNTAEIFHPDTRTFEAISSTMASGRYDHSSTTLTNGMVLIAGGSGASGGGAEQSAQLYDPITRTFTPTLNLLTQRVQHTATRLADGRVLLHGGYSGFQSEVFNPATSTFATTATPVVSYRNRHTATLLPNGTVLIAGGGGSAAGTTAEVFNPVSGTFTAVGAMQKPRVEHTAALLSDGSVLLAGGYDDTGTCCLFPPHSSMERYVPGTGFVGAGSMQVARYQHTASSLADGTTLLTGTHGWSSIGGRTAEIYDPVTAVALVSVATPVGNAGAAYAGFTLLGSGGGGGPYAIVHRSGRLPSGLTYVPSTGTISGTPTESGTFTMTFTVSDALGNANSQTVTVRIDPLTVTTVNLPTAQIGVSYNAQLTATGLVPIIWSLAPASGLPAGLTLNPNGTITGTPTTVQFASFSVRATDGVGQVALRQMFISVINP